MHNEHLLIVKLADIIDAIVFITEEGIGVHAKKVTQILYAMLDKKLKQGQREFPQYTWAYTSSLLNDLLQNEDSSKIAFEG